MWKKVNSHKCQPFLHWNNQYKVHWNNQPSTHIQISSSNHQIILPKKGRTEG